MVPLRQGGAGGHSRAEGGTELDQRSWELGWEYRSEVTERKERRWDRDQKSTGEMAPGPADGEMGWGRGQGREEGEMKC